MNRSGETILADAVLCAVTGCDKPAHCQLMCNGHYYRYKRYGDPLAGRTPDGEPEAFLRRLMAGKNTDCIYWPYAKGRDGYGQVRYLGKMWRPARLLCQWKYGDPPTAAHQAAHSCGKGHLGCVNPQHVSWKSPLQNSDDKRAHGTVLAREYAPAAKLGSQDVERIRQIGRARTQESIAAEFGVSQAHVSKILLHKIWT